MTNISCARVTAVSPGWFLFTILSWISFMEKSTANEETNIKTWLSCLSFNTWKLKKKTLPWQDTPLSERKQQHPAPHIQKDLANQSLLQHGERLQQYHHRTFNVWFNNKLLKEKNYYRTVMSKAPSSFSWSKKTRKFFSVIWQIFFCMSAKGTFVSLKITNIQYLLNFPTYPKSVGRIFSKATISSSKILSFLPDGNFSSWLNLEAR